MQIRLAEISKYYINDEKSTRGVDNISLEFNSPSFVVITGESGSGKSTLARLLTGIEEYDEGEIFFDGQAISSLPNDERHKIYAKNIAFVFQDYNVIEGFSCLDNIVLALVKQGISVKEAKIRANEALDKVKLEDLKKKTVNKLSGGEKQRVAIARALACDTKVIVFDEPTGNLDPQTSEEIINLIKEICADKLIIFITHEFSQVKDCYTRHLVLKDGKIYSDVYANSVRPDQDKFDSNIKFPFKSLLYVTNLFTFKRFGRFIVTTIVFFLLCLASFGISSSLAGFLTTKIGERSGYQVGNRIEVDDRKDLSLEELSKDGFYDVNSLLCYNSLYLYDKSQTDSISRYSEASVTNKNESSIIPYTPASQISLALPKGAKYTNKKFVQDENGFALVIPKDLYNSGVSLYYNTLLDKEVTISPISSVNSNLILKNKSSTPTSSFFDMVETSTTAEIDTDLLALLKESFAEAPKFRFNGVYVSSEDNFVYDEPYFYFSSIDSVKKVFDYCKEFYFKYSKLSSLSIKTYDFNIKYEGNEFKNIDVKPKQSSDTFFGVEQNSSLTPAAFGIDDVYDENEQKLYLSDYWQDKELDIYVSGFKYSKDAFANYIYYIPKNSMPSQYTFFYTQNPFVKISFDSANSGSLIYSSEKIANNMYESLKDRATLIKINPFKYRNLTANKMNNGILFNILYLLLFVVEIGGLFLFMLIYRSILRRLYFRRAADQNVLHYIGYSKKEIFLTNLIQTETIVFYNNLAIYLFSAIRERSVREFLIAIPYVYIITILMTFVFALYVSLPFKSIGLRSKKKND